MCPGSSSLPTAISLIIVSWDQEAPELSVVLWVEVIKKQNKTKQGARHMETLPSRRWWHSGVWQRQSMKTVPVVGYFCKALLSSLRCVFN